MYGFVFRTHLRLALDGMLLFVVGLFLSWPVVHYRLRAVARLPLAVFRVVLRVLGPSPSMLRMVVLIFGFNSVAIFIYMAVGFHPLLPMIFGIWTGMNIGIIMGMAAKEAELIELTRPAPAQWAPTPGLAVACGPAVLLIELPCFWLSIAMGISMGHEVQAGVQAYPAALALRARAYVTVLVPLLLASALAEAVAIRGSAAHNRTSAEEES